MTTKGAAWDALQEAMQTTPPLCADAPEFTSDNLSPDDAAWCASVCNRCEVLELCGDYADRARPSAGFWAGKSRRGAIR